MKSHLVPDVLESESSITPIETEPAGRRTVPEVELPKETLPARARFVSAALKSIIREEVAEIDRIRLADLAARGRLADMD